MPQPGINLNEFFLLNLKKRDQKEKKYQYALMGGHS
jgi:hypothetical protein